MTTAAKRIYDAAIPQTRLTCKLPTPDGACNLNFMHSGACAVYYQIPIPQTADELRAAGMVFIGKGDKK